MSFIILHKIDTRYRREDEGDAPRVVPVAVAVDKIRCFNPRREGAGTRITFSDGGGYAVTEAGADILAMVGSHQGAEYAAPVPEAPVLTASTDCGDAGLN